MIKSFSEFINESKVTSTDKKLEAFFDALSSRGQLYKNPMNPRELVFDDKATLEINRFDKKDRNEIVLQDIMVLDKSQGVGTEVMKAITDSADELGYKITLDAKPFGSDPKGLKMEKLVDFYKKNGFVVDMTGYGGDFKTEKQMVNYAKKNDESVPMFREAIS